MMSTYPVLEGRPIDQWKVTELKEELRRRKLKTGGLKEELVKRLDEAIQNELEQEDVPSDNGSQSEASNEQEAASTLVSDEMEKDTTPGPGDNLVEQNVVTNEELNKDTDIHATYEKESLDVSVSEKIQDVTSQPEHISEKLEDENPKPEVNDDSANANEETVEELKVLSCIESSSSDIKQENEVTVEVKTEIVTESKMSVISFSGGDLPDDSTRVESGDLKAKLENEDSGTELVDTKVDTSDPNNQVPEVSPIFGFQVKSDSISTESVTINEKNELKDNIIADDVKLEPDVKPEMVYGSSSDDIPDDGKSHPMDVEEPQANKMSVEETCADNAEYENLNKENDTGVLGSSEKLNLDRSSGDDFMDEEGMEVKQIELKPYSEEVSFRGKELEASDAKVEGLVDIVGEEDTPDDVKVAFVEEKNGDALPLAKRKLDDHKIALNSDTTKRQRRWNSEGLKVSEQRSDDVVSVTPKGAFKRPFSRSGSTVGEEAPKERVVPPSSKAPTSSLRIDRFLRPFTLRAVQELLGKTGSVTDFWMDHIKTHCYVSYLSVEEAVETRNAVYNLQWPPNGGHLLVAEFVDPKEVKARLEPPPPQAPAAPVSASASASARPTANTRNPAPQPVPTQPSPRLQVQKQPAFLPPPPPPPLANPPAPATRDHQPPVKERLTLPPPPPLPEKADPPLVTLDDLFRKTKATPRIYYLPLSEGQVAEKLQSQGMTVKQ